VKSAALGRRNEADGRDNDDVARQRNETGIKPHGGIVLAKRKGNEDEHASHNSREHARHGYAL
jgi:hypothetical protein